MLLIKKHIKLNSNLAYTLIEIMMASAILALTSAFLMYIIIFTAKSEQVLGPQMASQLSAHQASQMICDILKNSKLDTITTSSHTINFDTIELDDTMHSSITLVGDEVIFDPDTSTDDDERVIGKGIADLAFNFNMLEQLIDIRISFEYRKFRGYGQTADEKLNGTFETNIYPRNQLD